MGLTASQENYLEHILRLAEVGTVTVTDLAHAAGVRKPSVSRAVGNLVRLELVEHLPYGAVELTPTGRRMAEGIRQRDRSLTRFLVDLLGMDPTSAEDEVCRIEHVINDEVLARLEILLEATSDPALADWRRRLGRRLKKMNRNTSDPDTGTVGASRPHPAGGDRTP